MTQLLISVKNIEEALIARYADVEVIDLKDPSVGALGALEPEMVERIVNKVDGGALVSATVGEGHQSVSALMNDIKLFESLGVDVVKIAVSDLFNELNFSTEVEKLTKVGVKLVAVFFADSELDMTLVPKLQACGFYGVMLDTQFKQHSLLDVQSIDSLKSFVSLSAKHQLISGLAGSVSKSHIDTLLKLGPTFIGLRGGVCIGHQRVEALESTKVIEVKGMLLNYNTTQ